MSFGAAIADTFWGIEVIAQIVFDVQLLTESLDICICEALSSR